MSILAVALMIIGAVYYSGGEAMFRYELDFHKAHHKAGHGKNKSAATFIGLKGHEKVYIPDDARHIFVCGTTGSGKTVALTNFFKSGIDKDYPMLIIDGKGDTGAGSIREFLNKHKGSRKLYVIDMNNPGKQDKYNPFKNANPTIVKDMLINMSDWTEEHYKANVSRYLQRLADLMVKNEERLDMENIVFHIPATHFLELSTRLVKAKIITKAEHSSNIEIAGSSSKIAADAAARFATLIESETGQLFAGDGIDIYTALAEEALILFIMNPLMYPETANLFGRLLIIDAKKAVSRLFAEQKKRVLFIFDEINVYASDSLLNLVNKSRSAGVTCILACQSLSDLDASVSEYFRGQIIENCNNYIILRQNNSSNAETLANTIGTKSSLDITYQIKEGEVTGLGSMHKNREFYYHPDDIKALRDGEAIILLKDTGYKAKVKINYIRG
jgi:type IV secretory pathway TraG/TraD family ATPase VirD4